MNPDAWARTTVSLRPHKLIVTFHPEAMALYMEMSLLNLGVLLHKLEIVGFFHLFAATNEFP